MTNSPEARLPVYDDQWPWPELREALANLRYGTITLVVHDGKVVQLERLERVRSAG